MYSGDCLYSKNIETMETPKYKSKLTLGGVDIMLTKKFNWFNRLMLRLIFGLKIEKADDENGIMD